MDEHLFYPCPIDCSSKHKNYVREIYNNKWIPCDAYQNSYDGHRPVPYHYYDYVNKNESPDFIEICLISYFS